MRRGTINMLLGCSLAAGVAGCGAAGAGAEGGAVTFTHQGSEQPPVLSLGTWQYVPPGSGTIPRAASVGVVDPQVNYSLALRTASIKLTGDLPTMDEIKQMETAVLAGSNPKEVYEGLIRKYLNDTPRFTRSMVQYWRDTLRMGGTIQGLVSDTNTLRAVDLEPGPRFAASLTVSGDDMRKLFTQATNTCPTLNDATGVFTAAACTAKDGAEGLAEGDHAGILTQPAFLAHYYSNYAFRRTRVMQEIFNCAKFPAEFAATPERGDGYLYTSPWPLKSVTSIAVPPYSATTQGYTQRKIRANAAGGANTTVTDMKKYTYVSFEPVCANCHTSLNHQAPLFMNFDAIGVLRPRSMVQTPVDDAPFAQLIDYFPAGEKLSYRYLKETPNVKAFGQAMADDPSTARCMIVRAWNRAMSRGDVVNELAIVPDQVVKDVVDQFRGSLKYNLKEALFLIYTHPSFIRY